VEFDFYVGVRVLDWLYAHKKQSGLCNSFFFETCNWPLWAGDITLETGVAHRSKQPISHVQRMLNTLR
jgi:hypothetical protein